MNPGPDNKKIAIVKTPIPGKKITQFFFEGSAYISKEGPK